MNSTMNLLKTFVKRTIAGLFILATLYSVIVSYELDTHKFNRHNHYELYYPDQINYILWI